MGVEGGGRAGVERVTKEELAQALQRELGEPTFEEARELVEDVFEVIAEGLLRDELVEVDGFGSFRVARKLGTHETTVLRNGVRERVVVGPAAWVSFRSSRALKRLLNPNWKPVVAPHQK